MIPTAAFHPAVEGSFLNTVEEFPDFEPTPFQKMHRATALD
jgi:hypothetical protein